MEYMYEKRDSYEDFARGKMLLNASGTTAFPVKLASELFLRGRAYLLERTEYLERIAGSDIDDRVLEIAKINMSMVNLDGLDRRLGSGVKMTSDGLIFGIYPFSAAGTPTGLAVGPDDDYERIQEALQLLRGNKRMLFPRNYLVFSKPNAMPGLISYANRLLHAGLLGDLVIGWVQTAEIDFDEWIACIRQVVRDYGPYLASLQITNEPNLSFMEGSKPYARQALMEGVIAAKEEARSCGLQMKIGFGSVPESSASVPGFWEGLAANPKFIDSVDFVGHNFYVDVFEEPLALPEVADSVERIIRNLRKNMAVAGIPGHVPIRVTENGWPTGQNPFTHMERTYDQQSAVLEAVIRTVYRLRKEYLITHYTLFGLRDADSLKSDLFHQFGIMRDDYAPKPAFAMYKRLIEELGFEANL